VAVIITPRGGGVHISGVFGPEGNLKRLEFEAGSEHGCVRTADLRRLPAISTLRQCEAMAREAARQILAGVPEEDIVISTAAPAEALRALHRAARKPARQVARGQERAELLARVAAAYRKAVDDGNPVPREALARQLGYSRAHIGRLLMAARKAQPPLLGPARPGKAGETALPG
jgi:hypothetical protein